MCKIGGRLAKITMLGKIELKLDINVDWYLIPHFQAEGLYELFRQKFNDFHWYDCGENPKLWETIGLEHDLNNSQRLQSLIFRQIPGPSAHDFEQNKRLLVADYMDKQLYNVKLSELQI